MADNDELDLDELDPAEPANWKRLRDYAKRQQDEAQAARGLARENAFLKAGIDISTRLGQAFAATYSGKLDDADAILTDAKDFDPRIIKGQTATEAPETGSAGAGEASPATTGSNERQTLADGAETNPETGNAREEALVAAKKALDRGASFENAGGELVARLARGVADGKIAALDSRGRPYQPR